MSISISNGDFQPCIVTLTWASAFRHSWAVERSRPSARKKALVVQGGDIDQGLACPQARGLQWSG